MLRSIRLGSLILTLLTSNAVLGVARAQSVPYFAVGTGAYSPVNGDYGGKGIANLLGAHTFLGNVTTSPTANPMVFNFVSTVPQVTIGAGGERINFTSSGQVTLIPLDHTFTRFSAIWTGDFVVVGGTGRFAHARPAAQPLHVIAINDPFTFADPVWSFCWELTGRIVLH
jgi:hypothetical protein